jgi:hypothetical protein
MVKAIKIPKEYGLPLRATAFDCSFCIPPSVPNRLPKEAHGIALNRFYNMAKRGAQGKNLSLGLAKRAQIGLTQLSDLLSWGAINFPFMKISKP